MKKIVIALFLFMTFFAAHGVHADEVAGQSASLSYSKDSYYCSMPTINYAQKRQAIKAVLEKYGSPLTNHVDDFIATCSKYGIDCYLLPSIAGLESTFGKFIYPNSNNGWGWGGGYIMFDNWAQGIDSVGYGLKNNYIDRGANTVDKIGPIYSESPTWAVRVNRFISEFEKEETKLKEQTPQTKFDLL